MGIYISQPLLSIRLSTYSPELTGKNLKSLGYSRFARHYSENRWLLSIPLPTKMFQFGNLPPTVLSKVHTVVTRHDSSWVSPFGNLRFKACLAAPRSLSQPATSFFGILRQGILYVRLCNFL